MLSVLFSTKLVVGRIKVVETLYAGFDSENGILSFFQELDILLEWWRSIGGE